MRRLKGGVVVMILGFLGFTFGIGNQSLTMMEKIPIAIFCFAIMILGILIETPLLEQLRENKQDYEGHQFQDWETQKN